MADIEVSVLVVGGGLNGLATALFLSRQGVDVHLVERNSTTARLLRAAGVSARTMELFHSVGLEPEIRARGLRLVPGEHWTQPNSPADLLPRAILGAKRLSDIGDGRAFVMEEGTVEVADASPMEPAWCGQDRLEPLMVGEATRRGARVEFGTELVSFEQDPDGVDAVIRDTATGERRSVRARYLIAADGVSSPVRESLGITRSGNGTIGHVLSILFEADLDAVVDGRRFLIAYLLNEAAGLLHRFDATRWVFGLFFDPERHAGAETSKDKALELLRTALGEPDLSADIQLVNRWRLAHEVADAYRSGRVFLVGDACHVHPPAGGYGANSGMQDAHNLAWKLAAVLRGWAGDGLLDTYEQERHPVGRATADQAWIRQTTRSEGDGGHPDLRNSTVISTGYRYPEGAFEGEKGGEPLEGELRIDGRPGMRVPHVWLERDGAKVSTVELATDTFVLLAAQDGGAWAEAARAAGAALGLPLTVHRVGGDLADAEGRFCELTGLTSQGALLVRPDGFVAWRSPGAGDRPEDLLRTVLGRITARDREV
ncbi:FAD-dependent oxidoreductase [Nonomuraea longicatena]|uniref:FAD-dependent oxidoreductase n=1 Tax=Nonomuraea longicatena TaxID=83682 RepID=A0ABP4AVF2_9ACTN